MAKKYLSVYKSGVPEPLADLNPIYRETRSRLIALCEIFDGLARLVVGHRWAGITLPLLFWEANRRFEKEED